MGNAGNLYMVILIVLLIVGMGSLGLRLIEYAINYIKGDGKAKSSNIKGKTS